MLEMRIDSNMDETKEQFLQFAFFLCLTRNFVGKQPSLVNFTRFIVNQFISMSYGWLILPIHSGHLSLWSGLSV